MEIQQKDFEKYLLLGELNKLADTPKSINVVGNIDILSMQSLGVIGSRHVSMYGERVVGELIPNVAYKNIVVVSGFAQGCDYLAQKASIDSGGFTIGVLGGGFSSIKTHKYKKFIEEVVNSNKGLVVSEFDENQAPAKWTFVKRNRIIAALSHKLLVIEAADKSGTMHTVNFALEMGKEVLAVPGNIYNTNSKGTNKLLKDGAILVTNFKDILDNYTVLQTEPGAPKGHLALSGVVPSIDSKVLEENKKLLSFIENEKTVNEIGKGLGESVSIILAKLTSLELQGVVKRVGDKWVRG